MPKVALIGAGSAVFAHRVITDILAIDGLDVGTFVRRSNRETEPESLPVLLLLAPCVLRDRQG